MIWVYRTSDSAFLRDKGGEGLAAGEATVTVTSVPDQRIHRAAPAAPSGMRAATSLELDACDAERKDARVAVDLGLRAVAQLDFEERQKLSVKAGQTLRTAQECLDRVRAIYRTLLDA